MENHFGGKRTGSRTQGGKSSQTNAKDVLQPQRATVRQPLGTLHSRNDNSNNVTRVQPDRAAKNQQQQKKPLEVVKATPQQAAATISNKNNNKLTQGESKSTFSVFCDPGGDMEVEEQLGSLQQQQPSFFSDNHQQLLLLQQQQLKNQQQGKLLLQQQQQALQQQGETILLQQQKMLLSQQQHGDTEQRELVALKCLESSENIDPCSYSDMEMEDEDDEDEDDEIVGDDDGVVGKGQEEVVEMVDEWEVMMLREYRVDIYRHLREAELRYQPRGDYMKKQFDLTHPMRSILVDWMVEVVDEYNLKRETLFLSINYVDRFLSLMSVIRGKLQLLGAAAMFVAAKYEEIYPPDVSQFRYITDDTYTVKQILQMEQVLLKTLSFSVSPPTSNFFACELLSQLSVRCTSVEADDQWMQLTMYILEQSLLEGEEFMSYKASALASSAVLLSNHMLHDKPCSHKIRQLTGFGVDELTPCLRSLVTSLTKAPSHPQQAVYAKFSSDKFHNVAKLAVSKDINFELL